MRDHKVQDPVTRYVNKENPPATNVDGHLQTAKPIFMAKDDVVDVNSATEFELETLPGIGPADAETIIENRPYRTPEELLTNQVISDDVYIRVKNRMIAR